MIKTLNVNQKKTLSEIFGNLGIAWFSIGAIAQFFSPLSFKYKISSLVISSIIFILHTLASVIILRR